MKKTVYIETSIISYLTSRPSGDLRAASWQKDTRDWWENQKDRFALYASQVVFEEAGRGDQDAAKSRLEVVRKLPFLKITEKVINFSKSLISKGALPDNALDDSLHIALSAVHGIDYLLTWNCKHIDNAEIKPLIRSICAIEGFSYPEICTPQELMGV